MSVKALAFAESGIRIIPVRLFREGDRWRKRPHITEWRKRASNDPKVIAEWWREFPDAAVGIVLEHYGRVVVDCDRHGGSDGVAAFRALGDFPPHPVVRTLSGGEHHYFLQPDPPIAGTSFADGIDLLGTSRFVVGYELIAGPMPALPEVFRKGCSRRQRNLPGCVPPMRIDVGEAEAALLRLDPTDYREHGAWLALAMSAHAAGIDRDAFIRWSTSDPAYADDGAEIAERWSSFSADGGITARTLFVEARAVELDRVKTWKGRYPTTHSPWQVPLPQKYRFEPTLNPRNRIRSLLRMVEDAKGNEREPELFKVACLMREMIAERTLHPRGALLLLEAACQTNRLWREDRSAVRRTVASAFMTVEAKLKENQHG